MVFNSLQFAVFFVFLYVLYLFLQHKWQNGLLLAASCIFYAAADWRFLTLVFVSITTDFFCGLKIHASRDERAKKSFLWLSILVNLSILGFFKYFNFFSSNVSGFLAFLGLNVHPVLIKTALPLGISFYTFKTLSYIFDVYTEKTEPTRHYQDYALFVLFFPLLLAGPIMRADALLNQVRTPRTLSLEGFREGCHLIFWGLFQKIFVADNLATFVDGILGIPPPYNGFKMLVGLYAFAFQIYCDFASYSNIAMGIGRWMGFDITINFNLPYFSKNPQEFWNRWHISLSQWFRDYVFTPTAFALRTWGRWGVFVAIMTTFALCGLWHGAAWNFVIWGTYWGLLLVGQRLLKPVWDFLLPKKMSSFLKGVSLVQGITFFHLVCLGWLLFRMTSLAQGADMISALFFRFEPVFFNELINLFLWVFPLLFIEGIQYHTKDLMVIHRSKAVFRTLFYVLGALLIILYGASDAKDFVYFQF